MTKYEVRFKTLSNKKVDADSYFHNQETGFTEFYEDVTDRALIVVAEFNSTEVVSIVPSREPVGA